MNRFRRALLVEDHLATRQNLRRLVEKAFEGILVDEAEDLASGRQAVLNVRYDLALVDLRFPDGSGFDLLRTLREFQPDVLAIVATIFDDDDHLFSAIAAGADGYLLKEQSPDLLLGHLRNLSEGVPALSPAVARKMLAYFRRTPVSDPPPSMRDILGTGAQSPPLLSPRETEVLSLIGRGLRGGEVAQMLAITENTVAGYVKDIYRKLNISSRAEAALEARRRGLV